nr:MAG TPA_asm: hypothetical protein [Caudoviricetes sp.]
MILLLVAINGSIFFISDYQIFSIRPELNLW